MHRHDGRDLDLAQARQALLEVSALWRGPVQLLTLEDGQGRRLTANDGKVTVLETKEALAACREAA